MMHILSYSDSMITAHPDTMRCLGLAHLLFVYHKNNLGIDLTNRGEIFVNMRIGLGCNVYG